MRSPTIATFIEGEWGIKIKTYGHLYCTQEVSNQIMLLTILHEMVDFKKTSRTSQPCWCTTSKQLWPNTTVLHTFRLSVKIKKLQSIHCCGVGEFAKQTKTDKQPKTKQRTIKIANSPNRAYRGDQTSTDC